MKSNIRSEIEQYFALKTGNGAYSITSVGEESPAWAFRQGTEYGVLMLYDGDDIEYIPVLFYNFPLGAFDGLQRCH